MTQQLINNRMRALADACLNAGKSFIVYRVPGCPVAFSNEADSDTMVYIVPWCKKIGEASIVGSASDVTTGFSLPESTLKANYLTTVESLISRLKERGESKTVISRIIRGESPGIDWLDAAEKLWQEFPLSFGYLFYTPEHGGWLGASPEQLLVSTGSNSFATHALAGTLPIHANWDDKNFEEQRIVSDFIQSVLKQHDMSYDASGPENLVYGKIKHLSTRFKAQFKHDCSVESICSLLNDLAPTPALAGLPRDVAVADITELESHQRSCYGGYIAVTQSGMSHLLSYVIIRCVQFDPLTGNWAIYAGGGITPKSDPQTEWNETEAKASKIQDILLSF